jgi:orotidine-5'-phosphate decarboxylase
MTFASALSEMRVDRVSLCIGVDPHAHILDAWGLEDTPRGLDRFVDLVVEKLGDTRVVVKPQVAFFERHGVAGMTALAKFLGLCRAHGIASIGDAKRGDIGSTMAGYADAWLTPGSDFEVDALTLVGYQGVGALEPALDLAVNHGKGVFVLAATSNPEAWPTQSARRSDGLTVAAGVIADMESWRERNPLAQGSHGIVIGSTVSQEQLGLDLSAHPTIPVLAPGYGAQGASLAAVREHFPHSASLIPVSARAILDGGIDEFGPRIEAARQESMSA